MLCTYMNCQSLVHSLLLLVVVPVTARAFPLHDMAVRASRRLDTWGFQAARGDAAEEADWSGPDAAAARAGWPRIEIPAVWDQPPDSVSHPAPIQAGWFRKQVEVPTDWDGEIHVCFLAAMYMTDVFIDGVHMGTFRGGYTPFLVPVPDVTPGDAFELVVRVDNRLSNTTVPKAGTGWEIYGGLTREVYLLHRPPIRPDQVQVITEPGDDDTWSVQVHAATTGSPGHPLTIRLYAADDTLAVEQELTDWADGLTATLAVQAPRLWSPEDPYRYRLVLDWGTERLAFPVGIRAFSVENGRFQLNGEPLWLQGFGQHESWPDAGPILSTEARREDLVRMKSIFGANSYRTGHYPNHPDIFNLADELGLLVFTEVPAWQNAPTVLARDDVWNQWLDPQITAMLTFHRNHPSIFAWGVQNESRGAQVYTRRARTRMRELDATRPVASVLSSTNDMDVYGMTDLGARNLHYGWYHARSVYALRQGLAANLEAAGEVPVWIAELGGRAQPGRLGGGYSDDVRGTETYQDKMTRFGLQYSIAQADTITGISLWTWSDYWRGGRPHDHGILTEAREPKLAAYAAVNLMHPDFRGLALEYETVIPVGEDFRADLAVFSRIPAPGRAVTLDWQIRRGARLLADGTASGTLGEGRATALGELRWTVPPDIEPGVHHLYLELRDADGELLHSQALPFEPGDTTRPGVLRIAPPPGDEVATVTVAGMTLNVYPHIGLLLALPPGSLDVKRDGTIQAVTITEAAFTDLVWD